MKTQIKIALASALVLLLGALAAPSASASFGLEPSSVDAIVHDQAGNTYTQASGHPGSILTEFKLKTEVVQNTLGGSNTQAVEGPLRNATVEAPPGLIGNPTATPRCSVAEFMANLVRPCPDSSQVGRIYTDIQLEGFGGVLHVPSALYNLTPQQGQPALFGFWVFNVPVLAVPTIRSDSDYGIDFTVINIDQTAHVLANEFTFWGDPASPSHDGERGNLLFGGLCGSGGTSPCPSGAPEKAFLTLPSDCQHGPYTVPTEVQSWQGPTDRASIVTHDDEGNPTGVTHCEKVPFTPQIGAQPSSENASSPSGLDFAVQVPTTGLESPVGRAQANLKKAVVTLPEGFTLNPSAGEGLGYCTEAQFESEEATTQPGEGCPNSSNLGTVTIDSPILEAGELAKGFLYIAQPQRNPFNSLVALYLVARVPARGVVVKAAGKVDLDPQTGQITTTFDDLPQLPFSTFTLHFREGGRSALATPSSCGPKTTRALLYPYSDPSTPTEVTSTFSITHGPDGGACPSGGLPPFKPGLIAGSINNAAGRFSPFYVRLFRSDAEQEMTHFSIKLPPGVVGRIAGVPFCPDAAIAQAKAREHIGGGKEEQANPSCPASSEIGHTLVGAGVGSVLTYLPGKVYLAGPYHGSPLSIVAITSATVGPFDVGTVAIREALKINPETGEVFIDATGSDPIPHITDGVATHIRDLRTYIDRPEFTLNPTDCTRTQTASTVLGSGLDFASEADDNPITVATPFQAADCAALPFGPRLSLRLRGKTNRGAHPALIASLRMNGIGEAAIHRAQVTLPLSEFIENSHFNTICTREQFGAGAGNGAQCPPGSIYGHATAITPILGEALEGPIFLRSNPERELPDVVAALHTAGGIDFDLVGHVDSTKGGGIRTTFESAPDAPVDSATFSFAGAAKGLFVNSENLCVGSHRAEVDLTAHNGKVKDTRPALKANCGHAHKHRKRHGRAR